MYLLFFSTCPEYCFLLFLSIFSTVCTLNVSCPPLTSLFPTLFAQFCDLSCDNIPHYSSHTFIVLLDPQSYTHITSNFSVGIYILVFCFFVFSWIIFLKWKYHLIFFIITPVENFYLDQFLSFWLIAVLKFILAKKRSLNSLLPHNSHLV